MVLRIQFHKFYSFFLFLAFCIGSNSSKAQVLQHVTQEDSILAQYNWMLKTNFKPGCKIDAKTLVETPLDKCNFIEKFTMFPNPAINEVNFEFEGKPRETLIFISNLEGKIIHQKEFGSLTEPVAFTMSINSWDKGIYIVSIVQGDESFVRKLVKE